MVIALRLKTQCPVCSQKVQPVALASFLRVCPSCHYRIR